MQKKWKCRVAPSLGGLESSPFHVWGTENYDAEKDKDEPTVFFGLYGLPDFYALWRHGGEKHILWAGSDIRHFANGYWLEDGGSIKLSYKPLATWIRKHCTSWVENHIERDALRDCGIESNMVPSFLGPIEWDVSYKQSDRPKLYASVSGDDFSLYGWDKIEELSKKNKDVEFHLYGNTKEWKSDQENVFVHGRVSKEQMNNEIKEMQGGLRMTEFDGFSEIIAKSVLMGQYPVSLIEYPYVLAPEYIHLIKQKSQPNLEGRDYYKQILNNYPWAK